MSQKQNEKQNWPCVKEKDMKQCRPTLLMVVQDRAVGRMSQEMPKVASEMGSGEAGQSLKEPEMS